MDIDELCAAVNDALETEGIEVTDGRTSSVVTPRHIRYYRTIGLLPAPRREGRRATYDDHHLAKTVAIKIAQANGTSLEDLRQTMRAASPGAQPEQDKPLSLDTSAITSNFTHLMATPLVTSSVADASRFWKLERGSRIGELESRQLLNPILHEGTGSPTEVGWSVRVGRAVLSGFGTPPSSDQIERLTDVLNQDEDDGEDQGPNGRLNG